MSDAPDEIEIPPAARLAALCGPVVMVDELQSWGVGKSGMAARVFGPGTMSSHLTVAGDLEALHAVAARLKIRRFFQAPKRPTDLPHYDLVPANREKALTLGAIFVPARTQARVRRMLRGFHALAEVASSHARPAPAPYKLLERADLDAHPWAACGQTAVAALLRRDLASVRHAFPAHRWCNLSQMREALDALNTVCRNGPIGAWPPPRGLALIEFLGPWSEPWIHVAAKLKRTHWIAVDQRQGDHAVIFDVNVVGANANGGWIAESDWRAEVVPYLLKSYPKASGAWRIRNVLEVPL